MQNKTSSKGTASAKAAQSKSTAGKCAKTSNCSGKAQSKSAQAKSTSKASAKKA